MKSGSVAREDVAPSQPRGSPPRRPGRAWPRPGISSVLASATIFTMPRVSRIAPARGTTVIGSARHQQECAAAIGSRSLLATTAIAGSVNDGPGNVAVADRPRRLVLSERVRVRPPPAATSKRAAFSVSRRFACSTSATTESPSLRTRSRVAPRRTRTPWRLVTPAAGPGAGGRSRARPRIRRLRARRCPPRRAAPPALSVCARDAAAGTRRHR